MVDKKKTSVYLLPDTYVKAKEEAERIFGSKKKYSDWVCDIIKSALAKPSFLDSEGIEADKILKRFLRAQEKGAQTQISSNKDIINRLERLEDKIDSIMSKVEAENPIEDNSGRKVFE